MPQLCSDRSVGLTRRMGVMRASRERADAEVHATVSGGGIGAGFLTPREHALVLLSLALGTLMEWYDFQLYSGLSTQIANQFFPRDNKTMQSLAFWMVFALGFVTRPIGAVLFGHIGDSMGRRLSLIISISMMAVPTVLIGCLPSYHAIGVAAPVLMGILRVIQGLSAGGEYGTAVVFAFELAPPGKEGRHTSYVIASCQAGLLLGELAVLTVVGVLSPVQLETWGWRIPFLLVIFTAVLALALRLHIPEPLECIARARLALAEAPAANGAEPSAHPAKLPPSADDHEAAQAALAEARHHHTPLVALLRQQTPNMVAFILVACYAQASIYTITSYLPKHLRDLGTPNVTTQIMSLTALCAKFAAVIATGWAADRLGPHGLHLTSAGVAISLVGVVLNFGLDAMLASYQPGGSIAGPWVMQVALLAVTGGAVGLLPTIGCNLFDPAWRASGYSLSYSLTAGFVGGLSPMAVTAIRASGTAFARTYGSALWLLAAGGTSAIAYAVTAFAFPVCNHAAAPPLSPLDAPSPPRLATADGVADERGGGGGPAAAAQ